MNNQAGLNLFWSSLLLLVIIFLVQGVIENKQIKVTGIVLKIIKLIPKLVGTLALYFLSILVLVVPFYLIALIGVANKEKMVIVVLCSVVQFISVLPMIYFLLSFSFIFYVGVLKNIWFINGLKYSFLVVRGSWWKTFFALIIVSILFVIAGIINYGFIYVSFNIFPNFIFVSLSAALAFPLLNFG